MACACFYWIVILNDIFAWYPLHFLPLSTGSCATWCQAPWNHNNWSIIHETYKTKKATYAISTNVHLFISKKYTTPSFYMWRNKSWKSIYVTCSFRQNEHLTTKNILLSRQRQNSLNVRQNDTNFFPKTKLIMRKGIGPEKGYHLIYQCRIKIYNSILKCYYLTYSIML